jgi:hypothetical protein
LAVDGQVLGISAASLWLLVLPHPHTSSASALAIAAFVFYRTPKSIKLPTEENEMALRSLASHSTAQLRRLVGQLQAELDVLDKIATPDTEAQRQLDHARMRLREAMEAAEDAIQSLRHLQQIQPSALRTRSSPRRA